MSVSSSPSSPPKRALVTGASSGIGKALAHRLAQAGYQVLALGRHAAALQPVLDAWQRAGGTAAYGRTAQRPEDVARVAMHHLARRAQASVDCGALNALLCAAPRLFKRQHVVQLLGSTRSTS